MNHKYISLHILRNFNGCPNRGFDNIQKNVEYGGSNRAYVSSQSLNAASLTYRADTLHMEREGTTANLNSLVKEICSNRNLDYDLYSKLVSDSVFGTKTDKNKKNKKDKKSGDDAVAESDSTTKGDSKFQTIKVNITSVSHIIDSIIKNDNKPITVNEVTDILEKYCFEANLTGIMSTIGKSIGCVVYRSPSVATHKTMMEFDDFTNYDMFNKAKEDGSPAGSIHLGSHSITSFTGYSTYFINIDEFMNRMGEYCTIDMAKKILMSYIMSTPSGKRSSMYSNEIPSLIVGIATDNASYPTFLSAFENDVKNNGNGFVMPSVNRLMDYINKYYHKYNNRFIDGNNDTIVSLCFNDTDEEYKKNPSDVDTIEEFIDKLMN